MPDKTSINFNNILREERKSKLVPLETDFYNKAAQQIRELDDEKRKIDDTYGTKYAIIEDEIKTSKKAIESIIEQRIKKIVKEASLRASLKQKEKPGIESMTQEERAFYDKLLGLMMDYRSEILDRIFSKKGKQAIPSLPPESMENKQKEIPLEGKKDISKEYIVVRLLKDIPTFVGADGRNNTLAKGDVAVLSVVNAKALISRNAAIQILVKR